VQGLGTSVHSELIRTFRWKGEMLHYEFNAANLALELQRDLDGNGWSSVAIYSLEDKLLNEPLTQPEETSYLGFLGRAKSPLAPLLVTAVITRPSPFNRVVSPWRILAVLIVMLLFPFVTARLFARQVTRPLSALELASREWAGGNLAARAEVGTVNEIGRLATASNWMASEIQRREAELEEKNERLQEINALKSIFLASVSHELRTPLTAILGQTQMLLDDIKGPLEPEQRVTVTKTQRNASALLGLIDDLLDLSKIEAGQMDVHLEEFSLDDCLHDALGAVEPQLDAKNLKLEVLGENGLWAYADFSRTRQILVNLLANAVKFTPVGAVTVKVFATSEMLSLEIRDTGIGIPAEVQERIFDEFRQADSSISRKFGGTGLGLSIARKLAELQGGTLSVLSTVGVGSTFTLTLPAAPALPPESYVN
jgi:signal transduction histidine kinase